MKLTELKPLKEGRVDPNILMNIDEVVAKGKITSRTQYIIIAKIMMALKTGIFQSSPNWYEIETPSDVMSAVRAMPEAELVSLAGQFQKILLTKDQDLINKCSGQSSMGVVDWINFVNSRA